MISREEEIAELLSEFYQEKWYYYKEQNVFMGYNTHKIIESTPLDSEVEEDLKNLESWLYREKSMYVPDGIAIVNRLRIVLSDKDYYELNRKINGYALKLQFELNEIKEVVNELLNNPIILTGGRVGGKTHLADTINKLRKIISSNKSGLLSLRKNN